MCVCACVHVCFLNADWPAEQSLWNVNTSFSKRVFLKKGVGLHSSVLKHEVIMWSSDMIGCWRSDAHTTTHSGPPFPRTHPLLTSQYSAVRLKARAAQTSGVVFHTNTFKVHISFFQDVFELYILCFFRPNYSHKKYFSNGWLEGTFSHIEQISRHEKCDHFIPQIKVSLFFQPVMIVMSPTASTSMAHKLNICLLAPSTNKRDANNTNNNFKDKVSAISWAGWVVNALSSQMRR